MDRPSGNTTRYGVSRYAQLVSWAAAPAGADLAKVNAWSKLYVALDGIESANAMAMLP